MVEEANLEFGLRKIDETKNYLLDEIKHNDLISEKYKKTCKYLNYVVHLVILAPTSTGCASISAFASLVCVPVSITSSAVGIKICAITAGIKKYTPIIKKKKKNRDKTVLLGKDKLNSIEVLISKAVINSKTMKNCCAIFTKYTANKNSSVRKTKQKRLMLVSNYAVCGKKKLTFIKNKKN